MQVIALVVTAERTRSKKYPPRLMLRRERRGEYRYQYLGYDEWRGPGDPPLDLGFGFTLLFAHDHVILASTQDGAIRMADAIKNKQGKEVRGDYLAVSGAQVARYLVKNQDLLALDRVLEEGESMAAARMFWRAATAVVAQLELELNLAPGQRDTRLVGELRRLRK